MAIKSKDDSKLTCLQAALVSSLTNITDLEWNLYSSRSGLAPASKYSITDHKIAYYKAHGSGSGSLRDLEVAFFRSQGATGNSWDEIASNFFATKAFL